MKIINTLIIGAVLSISGIAQETVVNTNKLTQKEVQPYFQGKIKELQNAGGYTYILVDEKVPGYDQKELKSFWIAVTLTEAKVGDYIRFQKELVMKNFKSKSLKKTFEELMFASNLEYRVSK